MSRIVNPNGPPRVVQAVTPMNDVQVIALIAAHFPSEPYCSAVERAQRLLAEAAATHHQFGAFLQECQEREQRIAAEKQLTQLGSIP